MSEAAEPAAEAVGGSEGGAEAGADPSGAAAVPPGGVGYRFRDALGFVRDDSHPRWAEEEERVETGKGEPNRPDEEENPGKLGLITRGWTDAEAPRAIEGSPFITPTVPLKLRRAVHTNDMVTVRAMISRWTSSDTSGDSDVDSVNRRYATAVFDEHSRDTMLHVAVRKRHAEMVRYLVSQGARRNAVNRRNQTPLSIAKTMLEAVKSWDEYPIAMELAGHPKHSVNGLYTQRGEHAGFPRYANQHGIHLWHNQPSGAWLIHVEFTPESDLCLAGFGGSPKVVPDNTRTWVCAVSANEAAEDAEAALEAFQKRIDVASDYGETVSVEEERDQYLQRIESTGGRYANRVLTIVRLDEEGLRNAVEADSKSKKGTRMFRGKSYDQAYDEHKSVALTKRNAKSAAQQQQRPKRGSRARASLRDASVKMPGLNLSERRKIGADALTQTQAVVKALRGCFAQFQASNFAPGNEPWPAPESAWAGGPPEGEAHPAWADNDPITTKMHPHPDRMADCTAKPGGWQDNMKHRMEKGKRKPIHVAGLPGLLPPDTPGWAPPTNKVLQRPMKARIAKAHSTPQKWASVNHTIRSQIGQHHANAYDALVGSIKERRRTPGWLQRTERSFHRAHSTIPVETRGAGWR